MYDDYKHLLGRTYTSGDQDCYGLVRAYYKDLYGVDLTNIARPTRFWDDPTMNILSETLYTDGWEDIQINTRSLVVGDVLIFSLVSGMANHVGVYVGNGLFIHHIFERFSIEESVSPKWMTRCLGIVRHPEVKKINASRIKPMDALELRQKLFGAKDA